MKKQFRKRVIALAMALLMVAEVFTSNIGGSGLFSKSGTAYAEGETEYNIVMNNANTLAVQRITVNGEEVTTAKAPAGAAVAVYFDSYGYQLSEVFVYNAELETAISGISYVEGRISFTMPSYDVGVLAKYTACNAVPSNKIIEANTTYSYTPTKTATYQITFSAVNSTGQVSSRDGVLASGRTVVVNLTANEKYLIICDTKVLITIAEVVNYSVNIEESQYGTITASTASASAGENVTFIVAPNSGYELSSLSVTPDGGETQELQAVGTDQYGRSVFQYSMPASNVTVTAEYAASSNITINSVDDWNSFAEAVNSGENSYEGATVKLGANVGPVTTVVGTPEHPFEGTFDGQGYELTVNINKPEDTYVAPFGCINNAVIQTLSVSGTVTGFSFVSGLVGKASGSNTITSVTASTSVSASDKAASTEADHTVAGFIGEVGSSTLTFTYNAFDGILTTDSFAGGFIGRGDSFVATNVGANIFDGTYTGEGCKFHPIAIKHELATVTGTMYDNFYTVPASENLPSNLEGIAGSYILFDADADSPFCKYSTGNASLSYLGYDGPYYSVGEATFEINNKTIGEDFSDPVVLFNNSYIPVDTYSFTYTDESTGETVTGPSKSGFYTVTITGVGANASGADKYYGTASYTFAVTSGTIGGQGTEAYPYTIKSTADWNTLAELIDMGNEDYYSDDYSIYYELQNDITVDRSIGKLVTGTDNDNAYRFSGNFDGKGHTITFNATAENDNLGLFSQAVYANFKNLTVTGTIDTSEYDGVGGIVGNTNGACTFTNCTSNVDISIGTDSVNIGGFVGIGGSAGDVFTDCLFTGTIYCDGATRTNKGGFVGYANGADTFTNCVADLSIGYPDCFYPFATGVGFTSVDSYYISDSDVWELAQGIKAYGTAPTKLLYGIKTVEAGNINVSTGKCVYSKEIYPVVTYIGFKSDVYAADEAVEVELYGIDDDLMTEGVDYTVTDEVTESAAEYDVHTLTYTAVGGSNYAGVETKQYLKARAVKNVTVTEVDINGNASAPKEVNLYEYEAPSVYLDGYEFVGWKVDGGETVTTTEALRAAIEATGKDSVEVQSVYSQKAASYSLTVVNGTLKDSTETEGNYKASDQVFVTADAAPAGKVFSHWTIKKGAAEATTIVGYEKTYAFRMPNAEVVVTAVYADAETEKTGVAYLESYYKSGDNKLSFVSVVTVPTDCTILKAGVVANTEAELGGQELTIDTTKYASYNSSTCINYNSYKFTFTKGNVAENDVWCVRAFLEYKDAQEKTHVVYGDMVSVSLANFA
ncbi:MAG: hypothetical protein K5848_03475 [Lachnospiraceae bacterium]|nr:hypothetical protein [Lachnospiraceae bacterium]